MITQKVKLKHACYLAHLYVAVEIYRCPSREVKGTGSDLDCLMQDTCNHALGILWCYCNVSGQYM